MNNRFRAVSGEQSAVEYLKKIGYDIIDRNVAYRGGELDIVALDGDVIVIAEVKTRENNRFGAAIEAVTPDKVRNILKAAKQLIADKNLYGRDIRFDVICITRGKIEHIRDAFWGN